MKLSIPADAKESVLNELKIANSAFNKIYPGDSSLRQPVHTVYGGANLFSRDSTQKMPAVGTKISTGKGPVVVTRTDTYREAVWVRDDDGAEHRIAYDELPPGPYHKCGDCSCGKKNGGAAPGEAGSGDGGGALPAE